MYYRIMGKLLTIFTDGAYSPKTNKGGIGIVFILDGSIIYNFSKQIINTTNNKCELLAVIYALKAISRPLGSITIYSDSQYVIGIITKNWKRNKNVELWNLYDKAFAKASKFCSNINFVWTKGHESNNEFFSRMNNFADSLARSASKEL